MSVKVMTAVWELALPLPDKFVLLAFADHADESGFCFPSYGRVARKCGVSQRTVARCMANFRSSGVVEIIKAATNGQTQRLRIHPEQVAKLAPFTLEGCQPAQNQVAKSTGQVAIAVATESSVLEPSFNRNTYFSHPRYGEMRKKRWEAEHKGTPFSYERAGVR